ncbi:MAG: DUF4249 domain-containing protein [Janthinobacterium lividum]
MRRSYFHLCALASGVLLALGVGSCVEPYLPEVDNANANFLVVDGFINGNGRSTFLLSRSLNLATTTAPPPEKGAKVYLVDNAGGRYPLPEKVSGTYQSDSLVLNPSRQYQLSILTSANASYTSDLTPLKVTPPIDKLGFQLADGQVQLVASAHDASAQTKYYRWSCVETWEFNAAFGSALEYFPLKNGSNGNVFIDIRTTPIYTCWRTERPTDIVQTTSAQLGQDAISNYVIRSFSQRAERVKVRYSVLVSQVAETAEEFAYREVLRKNTEAVGTVNDPLPSQLTGNVHRVGNTTEPVLGFVGAHTVQQQRLFIAKADLPARDPYDYDTPYNTCVASDIPFCDAQGCDVEGVYKLFASPDYVPLDFVAIPGSSMGGISSASADCADCRRRGSNVKPSFW